jgi:hypothetical protein
MTDSRRESSTERAAESLRGSERAERLGSALAALARELADARRQIATLKRENTALRAQLATEGRGEGLPPHHRAVAPNSLQTRVWVGVPRRG